MAFSDCTRPRRKKTYRCWPSKMTRDDDGVLHVGRKKTKVIGLTGNIATGKSTVAEMFQKLGCAVLDADQVARDVMKDEPVLQMIRKLFGDEVFDGETLDRKKLGDIVFADPVLRKQLESLTHPAITANASLEFRRLSQDHDIIIYEAALLVEIDRYRDMDLLIVVRTDDDIRLERLMKRSSLSREETSVRLDSQMSQDIKVKVADYVIDNSGSLEETEE